jgi:hypothetical protein
MTQSTTDIISEELETGTRIENPNTPKKTLQWVRYEVYEALERCSRRRPDFDAKVELIDKDGDQFQIRMTFNNVGKNVFMARYTTFLIHALTEPA